MTLARKKIHTVRALRTVISLLLLLPISGLFVAPNPLWECQAVAEKPAVVQPRNKPINNVQEYSFSQLGFSDLVLEWSGIGEFSKTWTENFTLQNTGPAMLLLEYVPINHKPDHPGYYINGTFNGAKFSKTMDRMYLFAIAEEAQQIALPLVGEGRIYTNNLAITCQCINAISAPDNGALLIKSSSKIIIGDSLPIANYGNYSAEVQPASWSGDVGTWAIKVTSVFQISIANESLAWESAAAIHLKIEYEGDIHLYFDLENRQRGVDLYLEKNDTLPGVVTLDALANPQFGSNFYCFTIQLNGDNIFTDADFTLSISECTIRIVESAEYLFVIEWFRWPSNIVLGVIVLLLWFMPYGFLKFRKWRRLPGEIEINVLDTEIDDGLNLIDPEGLSTEDQDDDISETFEVD